MWPRWRPLNPPGRPACGPTTPEPSGGDTPAGDWGSSPKGDGPKATTQALSVGPGCPPPACWGRPARSDRADRPCRAMVAMGLAGTPASPLPHCPDWLPRFGSNLQGYETPQGIHARMAMGARIEWLPAQPATKSDRVAGAGSSFLARRSLLLDLKTTACRLFEVVVGLGLLHLLVVVGGLHRLCWALVLGLGHGFLDLMIEGEITR
jgi:hypothetical protein